MLVCEALTTSSRFSLLEPVEVLEDTGLLPLPLGGGLGDGRDIDVARSVPVFVPALPARDDRPPVACRSLFPGLALALLPRLDGQDRGIRRTQERLVPWPSLAVILQQA